jgi:hypothetical protein
LNKRNNSWQVAQVDEDKHCQQERRPTHAGFAHGFHDDVFLDELNDDFRQVAGTLWSFASIFHCCNKEQHGSN